MTDFGEEEAAFSYTNFLAAFRTNFWHIYWPNSLDNVIG